MTNNQWPFGNMPIAVLACRLDKKVGIVCSGTKSDILIMKNSIQSLSERKKVLTTIEKRSG